MGALWIIHRRCPAPLLPYIYNHFHTTHTFNRFCCSLLTEGTQKKTKESVRSSQMLLRAFLTDPIDVEEVAGEIENNDSEDENNENNTEDENNEGNIEDGNNENNIEDENNEGNIEVVKVLDTAEVSMNNS